MEYSAENAVEGVEEKQKKAFSMDFDPLPIVIIHNNTCTTAICHRARTHNAAANANNHFIYMCMMRMKSGSRCTACVACSSDAIIFDNTIARGDIFAHFWYVKRL